MFLNFKGSSSSGLRKAKAGKNVTAWAISVLPGSLFLPAITILELETGSLLTERRDPAQSAILRTWLNGQVLPGVAGWVLAINTGVVQRCARLGVPGPRSERDTLIAATALVHGMRVVTRNVADFEPTGVTILNP